MIDLLKAFGKAVGTCVLLVIAAVFGYLVWEIFKLGLGLLIDGSPITYWLGGLGVILVVLTIAYWIGYRYQFIYDGDKEKASNE
jgi:cation transporter-like permease